MGKLDEKPHFWLTTSVSEAIFNRYKSDIEFDEPIPSFNSRFPGKLESILGSVSQEFEGKPLNPTVLDAAAAYFNQIIRGHPFQNGNKRIAILLTHFFLLIHDIDFTLTWQGMYNFALAIASFSKDNKITNTKEICKEIIKDFTEEINFIEEIKSSD